MFWDMAKKEQPPYQRLWGGKEVLAKKYIEGNKVWCEMLGALEWEKHFPQEIARNNTYYVFSNMLYNYKTGECFPPSKGFFRPYHSEKNKTQKKSGEQVKVPVEIFNSYNLPKFPAYYKGTVTFIAK